MRVHNFAFLYFANSHAHTLYYAKLITFPISPTHSAIVHIFFVFLNNVLRPAERRQHCTVGCGHAAARFYIIIVALGQRWHASCGDAYINLSLTSKRPLFHYRCSTLARFATHKIIRISLTQLNNATDLWPLDTYNWCNSGGSK